MKNKYFIVFIFLSISGLAVAMSLGKWRGNGLKFSGTLELTEYSLGSRVAGRLSQVSIEEGDEIKKGALIATLDRYDQAKRDYERTLGLFKDNAMSQQTLEQAELALEDQRIVAPVDGVVLVKVHESGEVVASGSPVIVMGDHQNLWVRIYVPESLLHKIKLHQEADVKVDGLDKTFSGHVTFIATKAEFTPRNVQTPEERASQTFAVKVMLDHPDSSLRPGVGADVTFRWTDQS